MYLVINRFYSEFQNVPMVYGLADPDSHEIRYIGKSIEGSVRYRHHLCPSGLKNDKGTHKARWIQSLLSVGKKPSFIILFYIKNSPLSRNEINTLLYSKEQEFIEFYKKNLTNHQDAGPGSIGRVLSEESRKKMSESAKKRGLNKYLLAQQKKKLPEDTKTQRFCSECKIYKEFSNFRSKNHKCRDCYKILYKNVKRSCSYEKRNAFLERASKKVIAYNDKETIEFPSLRAAARYFGGKTNKTSIKIAIAFNRKYRNFKWEYKKCQ